MCQSFRCPEVVIWVVGRWLSYFVRTYPLKRMSWANDKLNGFYEIFKRKELTNCLTRSLFLLLFLVSVKAMWTNTFMHLARHAGTDVRIYVQLFRGENDHKTTTTSRYTRKIIPLPLTLYFITGCRRRCRTTGDFFFTYRRIWRWKKNVPTYRLFWSFRYISPNLPQFPFYESVYFSLSAGFWVYFLRFPCGQFFFSFWDANRSREIFYYL